MEKHFIEYLMGLSPVERKKLCSKSPKVKEFCRRHFGQTGGQILGKGTYGAAVYPARQCPGIEWMDHDIKYISKLFYGKNAQQDRDTEWKVINSISTIDPNYQFTIEPLESCDHQPSKDDKEVASITRNPVVPQIVLRFGGSEIQELATDASYTIPFKNFIRALVPLFEGVSKMHSKKIIHRDIKPANVLYSKDDNRFFLIDFGLACLEKEVYDSENAFLLNYVYPFYPPEFQLIGGIFDTPSIRNVYEVVSLLKDANFPDLTNRCLLNIQSSKLESTLHRQNPDVNVGQIREFLTALRNYFKQNVEGLEKLSVNELMKHAFTPLAGKADIYGLGVTFSALHHTNKIVYDNDTQLSMFATLLAHMKHMNPSNRLSADQVVESLKEIIIQTGQIGGGIPHFDSGKYRYKGTVYKGQGGGASNMTESPKLPDKTRLRQVDEMAAYLNN